MKWYAVRRYAVLSCLASTALWACGGDGSAGNESSREYSKMDGDVADCEFDVITFKLADASLHEVSINGLPVETMNGAEKVEASTWNVVQRRGVRFADILTKAGITAADATPVNCVARDGWDPLRTQLAGDTSKIPAFGFVRDHAYVYVGNPGDKDPLYPEMEGRGLMVDYDLSADGDVPAYLGGNLSGLGKFRYKMVEKIDSETKGVFEIGPAI